jgi:choline dehydrogenase-like flavoprotein
MTSVVVVGASVAGLLAARALAEHVDDVVVLERERLDDTGVRCDVLPARFNRSAARIIDAPWAIAVGADFLHPQTVGPKAPGTDLLNRYTQRLVRATHRSLPLARTFNRVVNLVEPPTALVRPSVVARVGAASVAGRRGRTQVVHPRVGSPPT